MPEAIHATRRQVLALAGCGILAAPVGRAAETGAVRATTVIFVRHAEKENDGTGDPSLSGAGRRRADALAAALAAAGVTRLFATELVRTQQTLAPLAARLGRAVEIHASREPRDLVATLADAPPGQVAVVAGHSNTVPAMVAALGGGLAGLDASGHLPESEHDRVIVMTLASSAPDRPLAAVATVELRLPLAED